MSPRRYEDDHAESGRRVADALRNENNKRTAEAARKAREAQKLLRDAAAAGHRTQRQLGRVKPR